MRSNNLNRLHYIVAADRVVTVSFCVSKKHMFYPKHERFEFDLKTQVLFCVLAGAFPALKFPVSRWVRHSPASPFALRLSSAISLVYL